MRDPHEASPIQSSTESAYGRLRRVLRTGVITAVSHQPPPPGPVDDPEDAWWLAHLAGHEPQSDATTGHLRVAELFCGAGGLAVGVNRAARELGFRLTHAAAIDHDDDALRVYTLNHRPSIITSGSVSQIVDHRIRGEGPDAEFSYEPEFVDDEWASLVGGVDLLLAGPPCQGHSNLNNHSRRDDPRNELYLTVPAAAVALRAPAVIIENVPGVVHDTRGVVATTITLLKSAGYTVTTAVLRADDLGWPQRRNRFFLVARRDRAPLELSDVATALRSKRRSVMWAIADLADVPEDDFMHRQPDLSAENRRRIDWLFDNGAYDLPLEHRPECHRAGTTYTAVYGRMKADEPAPTITTGFMTPGRGRFVHPTRRRVLTPHEAARLQGFPDGYLFWDGVGDLPTSAKLAKWIGDAVPVPLGFTAGLSVLGAGPFDD